MVRRLLESIRACTASIVPNVMKWGVIGLLKCSGTFRFVTDRRLENWPEKGCRLWFGNFLFAVQLLQFLKFSNQKRKLRWKKWIWMQENEQEFHFLWKMHTSYSSQIEEKLCFVRLNKWKGLRQLNCSTMSGIRNFRIAKIHYAEMVFIPTHFHPH